MRASLNVFMVFYALGQLFSGKVFDKVGTRIGFVLSIGIWSLSTMLHAAVRGLGGLIFFRSTLGISEAGAWPGAVKSNAEWFPIKERAIAQGLFNAGASIGSVIAPLSHCFSVRMARLEGHFFDRWISRVCCGLSPGCGSTRWGLKSIPG
jgi:MFS family permease